jgi:SpoVK/Ycf46/Vps4 family AAA+-type ATPase
MSIRELELADLFEETIELPNPRAQRRFAGLIGIESQAEDLLVHARVLLDPSLLQLWGKKHHPGALEAVSDFADRPPLVLLAGDVGCGKTTLAETFADQLARDADIAIHVMRLSLRVRGRGAVGEMTTLIGAAFDEVRKVAALAPVIFIIDEADAIGQARQKDGMHHEDRAGVNALIRGIGEAADRHLRVLVVLCTNRAAELDAALERRMALRLDFPRPSEQQRLAVLRHSLAEFGLTDEDLADLARRTGATAAVPGYTYSDIRQRLVPNANLDAFRQDKPLTVDNLIVQLATMTPTKHVAE